MFLPSIGCTAEIHFIREEEDGSELGYGPTVSLRSMVSEVIR